MKSNDDDKKKATKDKLEAKIEQINEKDKKIIDIVFKTLYTAADKPSLDFEQEILLPNKIKIAPVEIERVWHILLSSEWVSPVMGFGKAGKIALTPHGFQLMLQYGSYFKYLESTNKAQASKPTVHTIDSKSETGVKPIHVNTETKEKKRDKN